MSGPSIEHVPAFEDIPEVWEVRCCLALSRGGSKPAPYYDRVEPAVYHHRDAALVALADHLVAEHGIPRHPRTLTITDMRLDPAYPADVAYYDGHLLPSEPRTVTVPEVAS